MFGGRAPGEPSRSRRPQGKFENIPTTPRPPLPSSERGSSQKHPGKEPTAIAEHLTKKSKYANVADEGVDELGYFQSSLMKTFGEDASVHTLKVAFELLYNCSLPAD
ncbi:conserved hypothetical protein [Ricinus communis]|uniref:Uncharacterized protein n=1 Tax=Ricinus communis TaxID=3988 RepID=B9T4F1_RICCO|nr:conserved hypothetical protein [Ricinus communis]